MIGEVDDAGRALLTLSVRINDGAASRDLVVWIDTAFDGELVVSSTIIQQMGLQQSALVQATLADGTSVVLETFECQVQWFGEWKRVEVVANDGRMPLLGIGLLLGRKLMVDYQHKKLSLE